MYRATTVDWTDGESQAAADEVLVMEQGADFLYELTVHVAGEGVWTSADTPTLVEMQIRETINSGVALLTFTSSGGSPEITIDTSNLAAPVITLDVPASRTSGITLTSPVVARQQPSAERLAGSATWDMEVTLDSGRKARVRQGTMKVSREVTR